MTQPRCEYYTNNYNKVYCIDYSDNIDEKLYKCL